MSRPQPTHALEEAPTRPRVPFLVAASIALGTLLNPLNSSMIAVALISLQHEFGVSVAASGWLISGFYLAASVGQPLMGRLADRFGPRRVFCTGLVIVFATALVALSAPSFGALVAVRTVQALGTSAAFPAGLALVRRIAGGGRPPGATLGSIAVANSASAALGPALGGFLVSAAGWRGVFAVNIPLTVLGFAAAMRWLPDDRERARAPAGPAVSVRGLVAELDLAGVLLFAASVTTLLGFLLSIGGRPEWALLAAVPFAVGAFAWRELRTPGPFLDLRALGQNRAMVAVLVQQIAVQAVFYAVFFGLPMWLERVRHFPPASTGLLMLPIAALGVVVTPVAARLAGRVGAWLPLLIGSVGLLAGCGALLLVNETTSVLGIVAVTAVLGVPNGFNNMGLQSALYGSASADNAGIAAGLFQTGRYIGAISSTALLGIVFAQDVTTAALHHIAAITGAVAVVLVVVAATPGVGARRPA